MNLFSHLFQLNISSPACSLLCLQTQAFLHHPIGMVIFVSPDLHVPSMGQNHSEHTCGALTSVPETPQWFSAGLCGLLGYLWFAVAAESLFLGCFPQHISSRASLSTFGYFFLTESISEAALIQPEELKTPFTA